MISQEEIIEKIEGLQSTGNKQYRQGLFPSQRVQTSLAYVREDNNIFFSALIAFTLKSIQNALPRDLGNRARSIQSAVTVNYPHYLHETNPNTYNFWQNQQSSHFPFGMILHKLKKLAIPADADDTSLIYLTTPLTEQLHNLKTKLENQYPVDAPPSPLTPSGYKNLRAYPTFFGKRIQREMDACVISNVLYLVFQYQLPWSSMDDDSIRFLVKVLEHYDYDKSPFLISPNYGNSRVILYHIARVAGSFNYKELSNLREPLIHCIKSELGKGLSFMETLLLKTSLMRFGIGVTPIKIPADLPSHFKNFYFFHAGMLTGFQNSSIKWLAKSSFFHLRYRCEAYYWTLLLEHLTLSGRITPGPEARF